MPDDVLDDELLAPQGVPSVEAPEDRDEELGSDDFDEEIDGEWQFAHGFPDTRRAVRIWVDEDTRHLTKVRLSTRWRDRLAGRSLEDSFAEAFFLANARIGDVATLAVPAIEDAEGDPNLGWDDLERVQEHMVSLLERLDELGARAPEDVRWADFQGQEAVGATSNGSCTVTLSLAGLTQSVAFDKKWLAKARMSEITDAVMTAHQKAYARYNPPSFVPGEHEALAQELAAARAALQSILAKGF